MLKYHTIDFVLNFQASDFKIQYCFLTERINICHIQTNKIVCTLIHCNDNIFKCRCSICTMSSTSLCSRGEQYNILVWYIKGWHAARIFHWTEKKNNNHFIESIVRKIMRRTCVLTVRKSFWTCSRQLFVRTRVSFWFFFVKPVSSLTWYISYFHQNP